MKTLIVLLILMASTGQAIKDDYFEGLSWGISTGLTNNLYGYNETKDIYQFMEFEESLRGLKEGWDQAQGVVKSKGIEKEIKLSNLEHTIFVGFFEDIEVTDKLESLLYPFY